jgi:hypothetical protein
MIFINIFITKLIINILFIYHDLFILINLSFLIIGEGIIQYV